MNRITNGLSIAALLFSGVMPAVSVAQDEAKPPNIASLWVLVPKAGHEAQFEEALKTHIVARVEAGDARAWQIFTVEAGDDLRPYTIRYCCFKWPDQDAYSAWSLESGVSDNYNETVAPHVESISHYYTQMDIANSNWPAGSGPYTLFGVTSWTPKPGTAGDRDAALSSFTQVAKEHGWDRTWSWSSRIGGSTQFSLVIPYENFSAMEAPDQNFFEFMSEHVGVEETAAVFQKFGNSFWGSNYTLVRLRSDLSMDRGDG